LPHSLTRLDLSGTPIRFLPESIKDLSPLIALTLRNCKMLQTLPELPSNLSSLDVSSSYSLQTVPNLIPWTVVYDCDQLVDIQDSMKLELIQKADSHMFRIMETVNAQIQPWIFQVLTHPFYCISNLHLCTSPGKFFLCSFYNGHRFDGTGNSF
jgi:hypothetical protein